MRRILELRKEIAMQSAIVKNVVLVHGGFVDGSGWQGVYKALKKSGYAVTIVQNPTFSLADDVAVTKRALEPRMDLPFSLVTPTAASSSLRLATTPK